MSAYAMVFDEFDLGFTSTPMFVDLWDYSILANPGRAIKFILGQSTTCCENISSRDDLGKMKSHTRRIVAVARMADPFAVWVR